MTSTLGQTVLTINHPQRDITLKKGYGFRGRNAQVLQDILNSVAEGSKGITVDVQQNGGTGAKASATITPTAPAAADTVTLNGAVFTAIQLHGRGTITFSSLANGDTITINGTTLTALTTVLDGGYAQFALGANDTAAAANAAALINAHPVISPLIRAVSAGAVLKLRSLGYGTATNAYTIASSNNTRAAISGATFTGGAAPSGDQWDYGDSNDHAARSLYESINRSVTAAIVGVVTASAYTATTVTVSAVPTGAIGNAVTAVTSNGTRLPITGSGKLTGGAQPAANPL